MIGSLLYILLNTRPDIAAAICILSQKICSPSREDLNELKRVLKYLIGTTNFKLPLYSVDSNHNLLAYSDANFAEDRNTRKSNTGYIFKFNGGIIDWSCTKQKLVTLSSTEAEFIALCETIKQATWIKHILSDINKYQQHSIQIYEDNQSTIKMIQNDKISQRTKHIDIKYFYVREQVTEERINIQYCPTAQMLADIMTKPLGNIVFTKLRDEMNFKI